MGNSGKGLYSKEEYLYYHLNRKQYDKLDLILAKNPQLLEAVITKDTKHTLLMRAAFTGNAETVDFILKKNPNINAVTPKGETALSIAVRKNKLEIVQKLVEHGANVDHQIKDLSILDLAILPGNIEITNVLYSKSTKKNLKDTMEYEALAKKYLYRYVNYEQFLEVLKTGEDHHTYNKEYLNKEKIQLVDPVPDPRETWKEWFKRNLEFKQSPLVERNALPDNLQPQNRGFKGKVDIFLTNWSKIDQSKKSHVNPKFPPRQVMSEIGQLNVKPRQTDYASVG